MKKFIKVLIIIISICVLIYCSFNITRYLVNSSKNKKLMNNIKEIAVNDVKNTSNNNENEVTIPIGVDFDRLIEYNADIKAWLYLDDSIINYPVTQSNNNSYYLDHSIDNNYNPAGSLFIDYRNKSDFTDVVTYIYGHHMKNNTMFGNLVDYKDQSYYDNHKTMYLLTKDKSYKIEIFASLTVADGADIYNFINTDSNQEIVKIAKEGSNISSNVEVLEDDKIIVLSTCTYDFKNARFVVLGKLNEV